MDSLVFGYQKKKNTIIFLIMHLEENTENFIFEKCHLWLSIIIRTTSQWKSFLMELPASNQREGVSKSSENILLGLY